MGVWMMGRTVLVLHVLTLGVLGSVSTAWAEEAERPTFVVRGGAYFASADTQVRLDATDGSVGTDIDFEDDLDLDDDETLLLLGFDWRFAQRHRLELEYFELNRGGFQTLQGTIDFGDETFPFETEVASFFNTDILRAGYTYSIIMDETKELALGIGFHITDLAMGIRDEEDSSEFSDVTAPLPVIGVEGAWGFAPKWSIYGRLQVFRLEVGGYEGSIDHLAVRLEHQTFRYIGFGLGYDFFELDVDIDDSEWRGFANYQFQGPTLYVRASF
jgi:hypothetical protein